MLESLQAPGDGNIVTAPNVICLSWYWWHDRAHRGEM